MYIDKKLNASNELKCGLSAYNKKYSLKILYKISQLCGNNVSEWGRENEREHVYKAFGIVAWWED